MPDYSKGKIYTIRNRDDYTKIYVGSTIQTLAVRFGGHKRRSNDNKKNHYKLYVEVNNNWSNWYIELYEEYPCNNKEELLKKEGEVIRLIGTLNTVIPGRTDKEYREDTKEIKREYDLLYRTINKDKRNAKKKEYYENNKDLLNSKRRDNYYKNIEKNLEKNKEKIMCDCGCEITKINLKRHLQSKKHLSIQAHSV
jgi:hypothetical protein